MKQISLFLFTIIFSSLTFAQNQTWSLPGQFLNMNSLNPKAN